jgi:hypothetical protein
LRLRETRHAWRTHKKIPMHRHRDFLYMHSQRHRETTISSEEEYPFPDTE